MQDRETEHGLEAFLSHHFKQELAQSLNACLALQWPDGKLLLEIRHGALSFPVYGVPDLTIYFDQQHRVGPILTGQTNIMQAFMPGHIRASGHLIWVFQTLAAFQDSGEGAREQTALE